MGILPNCKDPTLTALKEKGYNVVQLPRVDLLPTQLLVAKGGRLQRIGELTSVFVSDEGGAALPPIKPDQPGPNISGTKSADLNAGVGLNILGGLIAALGGSTLGINVAYAKAATIEFEFAGTIECSTELALIDQYLGSSQINPHARAVRDMLNDDQVYVVTSTLKSNTIKVSAKNSAKTLIGVDVPVMQGAIGGNVKVEGANASSLVLSFTGKVPLVFAFQAVRLVFDDGRYRAMRLVEAGTVLAEGEAGDPVYLDGEAMLVGDI